MKLSEKQFQMFLKNRLDTKENKYHNKKVYYDGHWFDSKKESLHYIALKQLEKAGFIKELELQKVFELQPKYINKNGEHIRAITYKADFFYYDNKLNKYVVEDTKGFRTDTYKLKKKMFEYVYPNLTIKEI